MLSIEMVQEIRRKKICHVTNALLRRLTSGVSRLSLNVVNGLRKLKQRSVDLVTSFLLSTYHLLRSWVVPTEIIIFHVLVVGGVVSSAYYAQLDITGWLYNIAFIGVSLLLYWGVRKYLRFSGKLSNWWQGQVLAVEKSRFSAGVLIVLLDTLHVVLCGFHACC